MTNGTNAESYFSPRYQLLLNPASDMIRKRFAEEVPETIVRFDELWREEVAEVDEEISRVLFLYNKASEFPMKPQTQQRVVLIANATQTTIAAVELLRGGFALQPGILLRNVIETLCFVLHLNQHPEDLGRFKAGQLKIERALKSAGQVSPILGRLYGVFSQEFAHLGERHRDINMYLKHEVRDDETAVNFALIRLAVASLGIVGEATFMHVMKRPRYFKVEGNQLVYDPTPEVKENLRKLLREPDVP